MGDFFSRLVTITSETTLSLVATTVTSMKLCCVMRFLIQFLFGCLFYYGKIILQYNFHNFYIGKMAKKCLISLHKFFGIYY